MLSECNTAQWTKTKAKTQRMGDDDNDGEKKEEQKQQQQQKKKNKIMLPCHEYCTHCIKVQGILMFK